VSEVRGRLLRADFSLPARVQEVAAVLARPRYGAVTELARRHRISRQHASHLVNTARRTLTDTLQAHPPGRPPRTTVVAVTPERLEEAVLMLSVDGKASLEGTQACIEALLDRHVAIGRLSAIRQRTAERARRVLTTCSMPGAGVHLLCDELYDHGRPILAAMEDEHLAVLLASREEEADGDTWGVHLLDLQQRGLHLRGLISDQGQGMARGVAESGIVSPREHQWDSFHFDRDVRASLQVWRHEAERAERELARLTAALDYHTQPRHGRGRPPRPGSLEAFEAAERAAQRATARWQDARFLAEQIHQLLQPVDLEGRLIPEPTAREGLQVTAELYRTLGPRGAALATLLERSRDQLHTWRRPLAERHGELCRRHGTDLVQFVSWIWRHRDALRERLPATQAELEQCWGVTAPLDAVREIWQALRNTHRASSVLEGFNADLRAHVHAHRGLPDSLLPLVVFRHNVRPFRRGVHRGQAPFVALGILPDEKHSWTAWLRELAPTHGEAATPLAGADVTPPARRQPDAA
jgi:hypothetical protein